MAIEKQHAEFLFELLTGMTEHLHALSEGAADVQSASDPEISKFLSDVQAQARTLEERAKDLLGSHLWEAGVRKVSDDRKTDEASRESFPASDAPAVY